VAGIAATVRKHGRNEHYVRYWRDVAQSGVVPNQWGGFREEQLTYGDDEGDAAMAAMLFLVTEENPNLGLEGLCGMLRQSIGLDVSLSWVQRTLASWGWTWRKTRWVHRNKYTSDNIDDWARYAHLIASVSWGRLKFIDESHICSNDLARKQRVGPKGRELIVVDGIPLKSRFSLSLLTSIEHPAAPLLFEIRDESNSQWDFFNFVLGAIEAGYIGFGDMVVVDNASVHVGEEMFPFLMELLDVVGAFLVRLPAYSPEFDPCEFVFGDLKQSLRGRYEPGLSLPARVAAGLQRVSFENIVMYYMHCTTVGLRRLEAGF